MIRVVAPITRLLKALSRPHSLDPQTAFKEFVTKMVLIVLALTSAVFSVVLAFGWIMGAIPGDTVLISSSACIVFIGGWIMANAGMWRTSSYLPPAFLLLCAIYGNYVGGIDAPAMLIYVLAIIMVAVLRDTREMYWALLITLTAFLAMGLAHKFDIFTQVRTAKTAFFNRIVIVTAVMIGITLLLHFLILQFRKAIRQAQEELNGRRAISHALEESEKKYRELVQSANSIILKLNKAGEITFMNEFAEQFFGYSSQEIIGRHLLGSILPDDSAGGADPCDKVNDIFLGPLRHQAHENENITRDGKRVWINWTNKPIMDDEGRFVGFLCVGNDITERHVAREEREKMLTQLLQAQKMEAIGTLTSGFAHDFNNILGGIMGSLSLMNILVKKDVAADRGKMSKYIQIAADSAQRASQLIRQLLLLSRRHEISVSPVDLNAAMSHVVNICKNSFPKSVRIRVEYGCEPMMVMADATIIEQILLNFCVNGSHAMTIMRQGRKEEGGDLDIEVSSVEITDESPFINARGVKPGRFIRMIIRDSGVGMDKETQERIFEPFFSLKNQECGTGLGLSMAYGFISRVGGFIDLESELKVGTTFSIYLPELETVTERLGPNRPETKLLAGDGTILVIDDEEQVLSVAAETLSMCGYHVLTADNGIDGLELYTSNKEHVCAVLLDVSMPYISGYRVYEKLKEINPSVKVLMSSGYSDDERIAAAMALGAFGFLQKPYTAEELSREIDRMLRSGSLEDGGER